MHRLAGVMVVVAGLAVALAPSTVRACGGLFCDASQPVNQAAERIIFADNGDGTVTAVIEIKYEGPSDKFAWVLPVPGVPDVAVSSTFALDRLQQRTNPRYNLSTTNDCDSADDRMPKSVPGLNGIVDEGGDPSVVVLASGAVGPYVYDVIMVNPELDDRAEPALTWLDDNGYDVTDLGPEVLRPYLEEDLNLIAFKLDKNADTGAIRPIRISYEGQKPFIPIRPTAVAANDDMGILVFVLGETRAVPRQYKSLELNEARIDWFNPMDTYDEVVSAAADEAGGQGFVTELAGLSTDFLEDVLASQSERSSWRSLQDRTFDDPLDLYFEATDRFRGWDGFDEVLRVAFSLPEDLSYDDLLQCPSCYRSRVTALLASEAVLTAIYERVIKPVYDTQALLDESRYVTRLYTTMSADEMTVDPSFDFNEDLDDVSNVHTAEQLIGCDDSWRVELASGDVVYGTEPGVWPDVDKQPAARRIVQLSTSGQGEVVDDRSEEIVMLLADMKTVATADAGADAGGDAGSAKSGSGDSSCGCRVPGGARARTALPWALMLLAGLRLARVRRRR